MTSINQNHASRALPHKTLLGFFFFLAFTAAAAAQSTTPGSATLEPKCMPPIYSVSPVTNPAPADRQLIMDLLHRYFWALDEGKPLGLDTLLLDGVIYELCDGREFQLKITKNKQDLIVYLKEIQAERDKVVYKTRHMESNTLLHSVDIDTVQGKTALLVTVQFAALPMPVLDYTATLHTTFRRDGSLWKFSKMMLVVDGAVVKASAR
ncbi:nuclear transport factor 2 family protein [Pararhizobium sp. A13]|uniref:nuclear transport factor 2 family protein n=1 Tax=Pararhizobium sp. A13 TaxID=3133975 RepID=UPI00311B10DB